MRTPVADSCSVAALAPVTLVVPVLNEVGTIGELLAGLEQQTRFPAELLFVDAGSTDGTKALIQSWCKRWDRKDVVCRVTDNPGGLPGENRNVGIGAASQHWIAFLDVGIRPESGWLETLTEQAENTEVPAVFGMTRFVGRNPWSTAVCGLSYGQGAMHPVLAAASLIRKDVFERVGGFGVGVRAGEDIQWLRKFTSIYGERVVVRRARTVYSHFPDSPKSIAHKWFVYERDCSRTGLGLGRTTLTVAAAGILFGAVLWHVEIAIYALIAHVSLRGILDPIRRSARWKWWGKFPLAVALAPLCAILIDGAKIAGAFAGLIDRYWRWPRGRNGTTHVGL